MEAPYRLEMIEKGSDGQLARTASKFSREASYAKQMQVRPVAI